MRDFYHFCLLWSVSPGCLSKPADCDAAFMNSAFDIGCSGAVRVANYAIP